MSLETKGWPDTISSSTSDTRINKQYFGNSYELTSTETLPYEKSFPETHLPRIYNKYAVLYLLAMASTLIPLLVFDMPGITDYPNHMARMYLLMAGPDHPATKFYDIVWFLTPNLGMDIIVPAMGRFIGIEPAMRAFLVVSMLLIMTGSAAIEVAVKKRIGPVSLIAPLFSYNSAFLLGFMNFMFSFGLALWAIALWIALRDSRLWVRALPHFLFVPVLFVSHLHGLAIYFVAVGAYELWYLFSKRPPLTDTLASFSLLAGAVLLAGLGMALGDNRPTGGEIMWGYPLKIRLLATLAGGYGTGVAILKALAVAVLVLWAWKRDALRLHPAAIWIAGALVAAFLILPYGIMGSYFADIRFMVGALFILPAFVMWHETSGTARKAAAAFYATVLVFNIANVTWAWAYLQQDYREIRQSIGLLEPQRKVLIGRPQSGYRFTWVQRALPHVATLAVAERGDFVPLFFTYPGGQVVRPRPEYSQLDITQGWPIGIPDLMTAVYGPTAPAAATNEAYWRNWTKDFDYLYLMYPTKDWTNPLPEILTPISSGRAFVLYRIRSADSWKPAP
jgi:hypothetical protein